MTYSYLQTIITGCLLCLCLLPGLCKVLLGGGVPRKETEAYGLTCFVHLGHRGIAQPVGWIGPRGPGHWLPQALALTQPVEIGQHGSTLLVEPQRVQFSSVSWRAPLSLVWRSAWRPESFTDLDEWKAHWASSSTHTPMVASSTMHRLSIGSSISAVGD